MKTQSQIDQEIFDLQARLTVLQDEKNKVSVPTRILARFLDGTVIQWDAKFGYGSRIYRYVAIKEGGKWYTTAKKSSDTTYTDAELAAKFVENKVKKVNLLHESYDVISL